MFHHFLRSKDGTTAIEYALIAGILMLAIVGTVRELGKVVGQTYDHVAEQVSTATE